LRLIINDTKNTAKIFLIITTDKKEKYFFQIKNKIYIFYSLESNNFSEHNMIAQNLLSIIIKEISVNDNFSKIIKFINEKNEAIDEKKLINNLNEKAINDFRDKIDLKLLNKFWPDLSSFEFLKQGHNKRINLKIKIKNRPYFLKIYAANDKYIDNSISLNDILINQINTPKIFDSKKIINNGCNLYLLLYQYVESNNKELRLNDICVFN
jgi:hypothetical protein